MLKRWMYQGLLMVLTGLIGYPVTFAEAQSDLLPDVSSPFGQQQFPGLILEDRIQEIRIEGTQRIDSETVLSYLQVVSGDRFDPEKLDASLKALFQTSLFVDVVLRRQGGLLIVEVVENPIINRVAFEGNDLITDEDLQAEIQLEPRAVYTQTRVQNTVERVLSLYLQRGRFSATVQPMIIRLEQNRVDLIFVIDEGSRTSVARINFIGNHIYRDSELRSELLTRENAWWRIFSVSDTYDPDRLAIDTNILQQFYLSKGYADFQVITTFSTLSLDHKDFFITFMIEEGLRYKVGRVTLTTTLYQLDTDALHNVMTLQEGDWYDAEEIEKSVTALHDVIKDLGYLFFQITPQPIRDRAGRVISLTFSIDEVPRRFIERITISGNVRTAEEVIRHVLVINEGDPFDELLVNRSIQRVRDLGFFGNVAIESVPGTQENLFDLDISVSEQSTGNVSIGAGYSTTSGFVGMFEVRERNLLGRGLDLQLGVDFSFRQQDVDLSLTDPYFLGRDVAAGAELFFTTVDRAESSFQEQRIGFALRFGYPVAPHMRQSLTYGLSQNAIIDVETDASDIIQEQQGTRLLTSQINHSLIYDRRNSTLNPTQGYSIRMFNDLAGLGGDAHFVRTRIRANWFISLFGSESEWVLSTALEAGHIIGLLGDDVNIRERFFLGGDSLRGFALSGVGPRDLESDDALGGNEVIRGRIDLRIPIGLPDELAVASHIFSDVGTLGGVDDEDPNIRDHHALRLTVGAGISWRSPVGPIRIDYSFPLAKEGFDQPERLNFSIGVRF